MGVETGTITTILSLAWSVIAYLLGRRHGRALERQRRDHEIRMEADRRLNSLADKMTDEYVNMARPSRDAGPHALARLGLDQLGSDAMIQKAIDQMSARSGMDVWGADRKHIQDVDLVDFFRFVREQRIDFFKTSVPDAVRMCRSQVKKSTS